MHAEKLSPTLRSRLRPIRSALARASILLSLALLSAGLSACAGTPRPQPAVAPSIELPARLETSPCLRGLLPDAEELTVGETLSLAIEAEARAECDRARGDALVEIIHDADRRWREFVETLNAPDR